MTPPDFSPRGFLPTLTDRVPGQAVMSQALDLADGDPARSWLGRFFGADPLSADSRPWFQGALGELRVGQILAGLGPEWTVLHAVPVGAKNSDIDHVLIGPSGVFTLNTKHHAGQKVWVGRHAVFVAGQKTHYLSHARHEAARAGKLLTAAVGEPVPVTPVVVFVGSKEPTVKQPPAGVVVRTDRSLLRWLRRRSPVLPDDQVARITAAAVLPGTWHRNPTPPELEPAVLQERFATLRASVRSARRRRRLWALGLLGGGGAVVVSQAAEVLGGLVIAVLS